MLEIIIGIRNGLTRSGPFSISLRNSRSHVVRPPTPQPMTTPTRSAIAAIDFQFRMFEGFIGGDHRQVAQSDPSCAYLCVQCNLRDQSLSLRRQTVCCGASVSTSVSGAMPLADDLTPSQNAGTPMPSGVIAPKPVMTIRSFASDIRKEVAEFRDCRIRRQHFLNSALSILELG